MVYVVIFSIFAILAVALRCALSVSNVALTISLLASGLAAIACIEGFLIEEIVLIGLVCSMRLLPDVFDGFKDFGHVLIKILAVFTFALCLTASSIVEAAAIHLEAMRFGAGAWNEGIGCLFTFS